MLQQTTVMAVIPYFNTFIKTFPTVNDLAKAPLSKVLKHWSGLGYYNRAKNLHQSAKKFCQLKSFPKTYKELIQYPGIGNYTSRAVSSIAFKEKVGVLDGNVIRVLCRLYLISNSWWMRHTQKKLQNLSDSYAQHTHPDLINQALMELGATVCHSQSPQCTLCPLTSVCKAWKHNKTKKIPISKPKKKTQIWHWKASIYHNKNSLAFIKNDSLPFLKGQWIFPGIFKKIKKSPFLITTPIASLTIKFMSV